MDLVNLDLASGAGIAVLGYCVVFLGIVMLMLVVLLLCRIMIAKQKKEEAKAVAAAPVEAPPIAVVPAPASLAPGSAGDLKLYDTKSKIPFDYYKEVLLNFREIIYDLDIRAVQDYAEAVPKSARIMETLQMEVL